MAERSSRYVRETRDKESWLAPLLNGDTEARKELGSLLATASLVRASAEEIEVPEDAEAASRERALGLLAAPGQQRRSQLQPLPAPSWFMRLGSAMRFVFTLGRRR